MLTQHMVQYSRVHAAAATFNNKGRGEGVLS